MSALLKPGAADRVRPLASLANSHAVEVSPDPRDLECAELRAQLVALHDKLIEFEAATADAVRTAREAGHREGLAEAETREAEKLSALGDGIDAAVANWQARIDSWDGLAAMLASTALARIFEPHADLQEQVTRMLARQLREIRRTSLIAIQVSRSDFADDGALTTLRQRLASPEAPFAIEIDPELEAGACRIACAMEHIDLDVREQWPTLARLLGEMAGEGGAP